MDKRKLKHFLIAWCTLVVIALVVSLLLRHNPRTETIQIAMRDAVLHEKNKINFLGLIAVNPSFISGVIMTVILLVVSAVLRLTVIRKMKVTPGKLQLCLEGVVGYFSHLAESNSPHRNKFLGAYVFGAGVYIFTGTLFELFGVQMISTAGNPVNLSAPLADINGAIALGCFSYLVIMSGGLVSNGVRGVLLTLKEFSLPISLSFRLFGALLSGLLVTELVYYYLSLSFILPVAVGVMFTLMHAFIQAYVLTMLTALFYGEVSKPPLKKHTRQQKCRE